MKTKEDLKKTMKKIKKSLKNHRNLQKEVFGGKKRSFAKGRARLEASRKNIGSLFSREEKLENHILRSVKTGKPALHKSNAARGNGVSHAHHDALAE